MSLKIETNKNNTVSSVIDSTLTFLSKTNSDWEIIPTALALWNGYMLKKTLGVLRSSRVEQNRVLMAIANGQAAAPMLIDVPFLRNAINYRHLRAAEEAIKRCYLASIVHGVRVLRFSAILLSPAPRFVLENSVDFIAYSATAYKFAATKNPVQLRYGRVATIKDMVYRWTKITTYVTCSIGSLAALMNHYQYIEESHPAYQTATKVAFISFATDLLDSVLQGVGLLGHRE